MKIKLGSFISHLSGKAGGMAVQGNNGSLSLRIKKVQPGKKTRSYIAGTGNIAYVSSFWRTMSESDRRYWNSLVFKWKKVDGSLASPYELFVAYNCTRLLYGSQIVNRASMPAPLVAITNVLVDWDFPLQRLNMRWTNPPGLNGSIRLYCSYPANTVNGPELNRFVYIQQVASNTSQPFNVSAAILNKRQPIPLLGQWIVVRVLSTNFGNPFNKNIQDRLVQVT